MKHMLHKFIAWYLGSCGGAFHVNRYGVTGRYVVILTEQQYGEMRKWYHKVKHWT